MSKKKAGLAKTEGNDMINFYESKNIKQFLTQYENPNFDSHQINVPFRISVVAASGS